jgi:hypothetical protein
LGWAAAVIGLLLAGAGSATAQGGGAAGSTPDAQVGFQRQPQLSAQDKLAQADAILSRMDQASATVRRQLERARLQRDVVKSLCLNDKLSQIDVAGRSAKDRQTALQAAVQRNDAELSNHEFTIMTVLRQRAEQLVAEANQCLGEEVAFVGQTQVSMEVNPNLPFEETAGFTGEPGMPPAGPPLPPQIAPPPIAVSLTH